MINLDLSDNPLLAGEIPLSICDLVNLEELEIEDTSVSGTNAIKLIPKARSCIGALTKLETLYMTDNALTGKVSHLFFYVRSLSPSES
jgi:Leucine-rich repeat (LRR) protein